MANQVDPATMGGAPSRGLSAHGGVTAESADAAAVHGTGHGAGAVTSAGGLTVSQLGPFPNFHGRKVSWVAVAIIAAGFLVAGLALVFGHHGPTWWLFWVGAGAAVLGFLIAMVTNMFEDWY
jgi:hypothetical protein